MVRIRDGFPLTELGRYTCSPTSSQRSAWTTSLFKRRVGLGDSEDEAGLRLVALPLMRCSGLRRRYL
jgi:hypothetical protein